MVLKALKILFQHGPSALFNTIVSKGKQRKQYKLYLLSLKKSEENNDAKREKARLFRYRPKISIIIPVNNTNEKWLRLCIESVLNQVYENWELCVADGCSTNPCIRRILGEFVRKDGRIRVKFLSENKGIAENSNEALSLASGEFIGFLDHDDQLEPSAIYEVVKLLNENPDIDFIYSDEDKISTKGKRFDPHFKPDWAPDTFRSCNYIAHFSVIRKKIIDEVGRFRIGYEGSQDYDLFLRVTEITCKIAHVPKVLYHWRTVPQSAASSANAKSYAYNAAKKAIKDSLERRKMEAEVLDGPSPGFYRVKYKIMGNPKVSIIIPTRCKVKILQKSIQSIIDKTEYDDYEILIIDNQKSESETLRFYKEIKSNPTIRIIKSDGHPNYSKINNYAVSLIDSEYIIFLNNDIEIVSKEWITAMLEHVQRKEVGIAGALLYYPNNTIHHTGVIVGIAGVVGHPHHYSSRENLGYFNRAKIIQNLSAVTGACMMIKRSIFEKVGGFDELFQIALGDIDLCLKAREKGYLIVYTPYAELYYSESLNRGNEDTPERQAGLEKEIEYFRRKWKDELAKEDPYYNPNLTLDREDFSINLRCQE